jgi:hypothetical protein
MLSPTPFSVVTTSEARPIDWGRELNGEEWERRFKEGTTGVTIPTPGYREASRDDFKK